MSINKNKTNVGLLIVGIGLFGLGIYILWHATRGTYVRTDELTPAAGFGGVGLLLLTIVLAKGFGKRVGMIFFLVVAGSIVAYVYMSMGKSDAARGKTMAKFDLVRSFIPVCEGKADPNAAVYESDGDISPTVILWRSSYPGGDWKPAVNRSPEGWLPKSREETQLVACVQWEKVLIRRCSYQLSSGGSRNVNYVQYHEHIKLYEAKTRTMVFETRFSGGMPPEKCASSFNFSRSSNEVSGGTVGDSKKHDAVRPYVTGVKPERGN